MKVKTSFSTIAFLIFFPPTEFFKNWYIYASDWSYLKKNHQPEAEILAHKFGKYEKVTTRSHFTHARRCSRALKRVPARAKRPASIRTYSLWKGDIFPIDHFTGYKKSNQNQFGRVLPFAFALKCNKIYLLFSFWFWFIPLTRAS